LNLYLYKIKLGEELSPYGINERYGVTPGVRDIGDEKARYPGITAWGQQGVWGVEIEMKV
jgi:hypothetical protein